MCVSDEGGAERREVQGQEPAEEVFDDYKASDDDPVHEPWG